MSSSSSNSAWLESETPLLTEDEDDEAEQERFRRRASEIKLSVDLVPGASHLVDLLTRVDKKAETLYGGEGLERALVRYQNCWLPLLLAYESISLSSSAQNGSASTVTDGGSRAASKVPKFSTTYEHCVLKPPLDVEWVWMCHRLSPVTYASDCEEVFGAVVDGYVPFDFSALHSRTPQKTTNPERNGEGCRHTMKEGDEEKCGQRKGRAEECDRCAKASSPLSELADVEGMSREVWEAVFRDEPYDLDGRRKEGGEELEGEEEQGEEEKEVSGDQAKEGGEGASEERKGESVAADGGGERVPSDREIQFVRSEASGERAAEPSEHRGEEGASEPNDWIPPHTLPEAKRQQQQAEKDLLDLSTLSQPPSSSSSSSSLPVSSLNTASDTLFASLSSLPPSPPSPSPPFASFSSSSQSSSSSSLSTSTATPPAPLPASSSSSSSSFSASPMDLFVDFSNSSGVQPPRAEFAELTQLAPSAPLDPVREVKERPMPAGDPKQESNPTFTAASFPAELSSSPSSPSPSPSRTSSGQKRNAASALFFLSQIHGNVGALREAVSGIRTLAQGKSFCYDISAAAQRQSHFFHQIDRHCFLDRAYLKGSLPRYRLFLELCRANKGVFCVPTYDVDLMWHTHMLYVKAYAHDTEYIMGCTLDHDDDASHPPFSSSSTPASLSSSLGFSLSRIGLGGGGGSVTSATPSWSSSSTQSQKAKPLSFAERKRLEWAFRSTCHLWEKAFNRPYDRAGAMYRGPAPPLLPAGVAPSSLTSLPRQIRWLNADVNAAKGLKPRHCFQVHVTVWGLLGLTHRSPERLSVSLSTLSAALSPSIQIITHAVPFDKGWPLPTWRKRWSLECEVSTRGLRFSLLGETPGGFWQALLGSRVVAHAKLEWRELLQEQSLCLEKELELRDYSPPSILSSSAGGSSGAAGVSLFPFVDQSKGLAEGAMELAKATGRALNQAAENFGKVTDGSNSSGRAAAAGGRSAASLGSLGQALGGVLEGVVGAAAQGVERVAASAKGVDKPPRLHVSLSCTPPSQSGYLLRCVFMRGTDDTGAMISEDVLIRRDFRAQAGRWVSRTVYDHRDEEVFVVRKRVAKGIWEGRHRPTAALPKERIILVHRGGWKYIDDPLYEELAGFPSPEPMPPHLRIGYVTGPIIAQAVPLVSDDPEFERSFTLIGCGQKDEYATLHVRRDRRASSFLRGVFLVGLEVELEEESKVPVKLVRGRHLQYSVENADPSEEMYFFTVVRFLPDCRERGRATALFNWKGAAMEVSPGESALLVLLLCVCINEAVNDMVGVKRMQPFRLLRIPFPDPTVQWDALMLDKKYALNKSLNPKEDEFAFASIEEGRVRWWNRSPLKFQNAAGSCGAGACGPSVAEIMRGMY